MISLPSIINTHSQLNLAAPTRLRITCIQPAQALSLCRFADRSQLFYQPHHSCTKRCYRRIQCPQAIVSGAWPVSDPWTVWALVTISAAMAQALQLTKVGEVLSAPLLAILFGLLLAAAGILPQTCQIFDDISTYLLPIAAALYLLESDLRELASTARDTVLAFFLATVGTIVGTAIAWVLTGHLLGPDGWKVVAALAASYIGGSINFAAVSSALSLPPGNLLASAMSADMVAMAGYLAVISSWPESKTDSAAIIFDKEHASEDTGESNLRPGVSGTSLSLSIAAACLACAWGTSLAQRFDISAFSLGVIALLASLLASLGSAIQNHLTPARSMAALGGPFSGSEALGGALMGLFFVTIGAAAGSLSSIFSTGYLILFIAIQLGCHLAVTMSAGRLLRLPSQAILTASNAAVGGPGTAAAMATSKNWSNMVRPALIVGAFGYSIGTPIGILIGHVLQP